MNEEEKAAVLAQLDDWRAMIEQTNWNCIRQLGGTGTVDTGSGSVLLSAGVTSRPE